MKLWQKILIGLGLGLATGLIFGPKAEILKPIGAIFLNLINMIIVLLVLSSMTVGITSIHDPQKLGRVGSKTLLLYLATTIVATCIGLVFAVVFQPGSGLQLSPMGIPPVVVVPSLSDIMVSIIPSNPIKSLVDGNVLQIIVFSVFLGISINFVGEKARPLLELLEALAETMYRLTSIVMEFSPIGVFAIMASVSGTFGIAILMPLLKFLIVFYAASLLHVAAVFCPLIWFWAKLHPWPFFLGMGDAMMVAFSTCSSSATLPVSMHCVQENVGVSKNISRFVLPLGSTINMNGAAIFQAMSVLFIAQVYGINLSWASVFTIILTLTLGAIGAAGIPGSGFIMLSVVLTSIGMPIEGLAILAGIDRIREMGSTVINILGDAVCALIIAKQEGELDERQYYHEELVELEGGDV